jgi:hypothetical protein
LNAARLVERINRDPPIELLKPQSLYRTMGPIGPTKVWVCAFQLGGLGEAALPKLPASNNLKFEILNFKFEIPTQT